MVYKVGGTTVIQANGKVDWTQVVNVNTGVITINSTMQVVNSGVELANGYYLSVASNADLRCYRVLGNCNCNCDCFCGNDGGDVGG